jgi:hypothetical protein
VSICLLRGAGVRNQGPVHARQLLLLDKHLGVGLLDHMGNTHTHIYTDVSGLELELSDIVCLACTQGLGSMPSTINKTKQKMVQLLSKKPTLPSHQ